MPFSEDMLSLAGLVAAALLTLMTLSYLLGDNDLFRIAVHLLVGVAAGYAGAVAVQEVIVPELLVPWQAQLDGNLQMDFLDLALRTLLTLLLLTKLFPRAAALGNPVTAMLVGIGAALAIAGAVQGTLLPQTSAAAAFFDVEALGVALGGGYYVEGAAFIFQGLITLAATVGTLAYFHFGAKPRDGLPPQRSPFIEALAWLGRVFIPITLASIFAGVLLAALSALIERMDFLLNTIVTLLIGS